MHQQMGPMLNQGGGVELLHGALQRRTWAQRPNGCALRHVPVYSAVTLQAPTLHTKLLWYLPNPEPWNRFKCDSVEMKCRNLMLMYLTVLPRPFSSGSWPPEYRWWVCQPWGRNAGRCKCLPASPAVRRRDEERQLKQVWRRINVLAVLETTHKLPLWNPI